MDDKRTPMEAEVQELPIERESSSPEDSYGTAAKPKTRRNLISFWIWMGIAVIVICTVCVVAAVKNVRLENGESGWRLAIQNPEETKSLEETVRNLNVPDDSAAVLPSGSVSDSVRLPLTVTAGDTLTPSEVYETVSHAVVCVQVENYYGSKTYTGVVISSDGCILSATDGLSRSVSIAVSFSDGTVLNARRLGEDSVSGVCLLKVDADSLQTVRFSGNAEPNVGQSVYSICNPYGDLIPNVFCEGMISACCSAEINGAAYTLMQNTALRESTEYGCPILDEHGLVLGITTQIGRQLVSGEDPGFAISSEDLVRIVSNFEQSDSDSSVWLGLEVADIPEEYHDFYRFPGSVWIEEVSAGSASDGILYQYDIITSVDGIELTSADEYESILASHQAGDRVLLTIYRSGRFYNIILPVVAR